MSDTLFDISLLPVSSSHELQRRLFEMRLALKIAWEQPDLEPDLGTNPQGPVDDAHIHWGSGAEFTLTLQSGQTIEVKFVPCLVGKRRMHEFSFTGPVSTTGFKSHFVLAVEAENFPCPRDYAQAYAEEMVAQFEAQLQRSGKKLELINLGARAPQEVFGVDDDSTMEPAMPSDETDALNHTPVEVIEELSPEEEADRSRLELKVERAFYEAGSSLRELRERRLYRNTHKTWEEYCQERFGYTYRFVNFKIAAADVFDNLLNHFSKSDLGTNCSQKILPNRESQCRELAKLELEQQPEAWEEAIQRTPGKKIPSASTVKAVVLEFKGVVDPLKQNHPSLREFAPGAVVEIKALKLEPLHPFNGMWAVIEHVGSFSYTVRISIARDTQQCKAEELTRIDDEYTADIKAVAQRIAALIQFELEPVEYAILELLQRSTCFTSRQLLYLERMEADYVLSN